MIGPTANLAKIPAAFVFGLQRLHWAVKVILTPILLLLFMAAVANPTFLILDEIIVVLTLILMWIPSG